MDYPEWNMAICEHFFHKGNAEREIYLFITKGDIAKIGKSKDIEGTDEEVFRDFIQAIKYGGKPDNELVTPFIPIDRPLELFNIWNTEANHYEEYPYYLAYLILFILPLTVEANPNYNWNNYHDRVNDFFKQYGILNLSQSHRIIRQNFYRLDHLWEDLQDWSFDTRNSELGYFELHPFSTNTRWVYVGKPLTQCVFPNYAFKLLPSLYENLNLVPGEQLDIKEFKKILIQNGQKWLGLKEGAIRAVREDGNELGESILRILQKHYQVWKGETDTYDENTDLIKKGFTIAQLRLCMEPDFVNGKTTLYFRLYSPAEYPEDLCFGEEHKCNHQNQGLSKAMRIEFEEGLTLEDKYNKWKAVIPEKSMRVLIKGADFQLGGWVEVPQMNKQSKMLLIARGDTADDIYQWGVLMIEDGSEFREITFTGLPVGYRTFLLRNPTIDHPDIAQLKFKSDRRVLITGGVKTAIRTYLPDFLPEFTLENGLGNERLYICTNGGTAQVDLVRKALERPVWGLPENIEYNTRYYVYADGIELQQNLGIKIVSYDMVAQPFKEELLPIRNEFGEGIEREENLIYKYATGSQVVRENDQVNRPFLLKQGIYRTYFQPYRTEPGERISNVPDSSSINDMLLFFLSTKVESTVNEYREAFDTIYYEKFLPEESEDHLAISKLKRWSLNMLDYMGFLDFDYTTNRIVVNRPQLIPIPTISGRQVLLIGGRTPDLVENLWMCTEEAGYDFNYNSQDKSLESFILPSTVTIAGFSEVDNTEVENTLRDIAIKCDLEYNPSEYSQFALAEFSGCIKDYENYIIPDEGFLDQGWSVKVFNSEYLRFIREESGVLDKNYSLVEYQLNEYTYQHRMWKDGIPYNVNKNWGRYMVLNRASKSVIYNQSTETQVANQTVKLDTIAIPVTLPLPRLLAEAMTLFSGKAPKRQRLQLDGIERWYNLYENIPHIFAYNYFMKVGQRMVEIELQKQC